jgi:DNA-binding NarL/FixJ family response regulator
MRLLVVDDHPMVRDSLHELLNFICPNSHTDLAVSANQMREMLTGDTQYDYAILDLSLPDSRGLEVLRMARSCRPDMPLVVHSARCEQDVILRCLNFGVMGFIPKTYFGDRVAQALRMVFSGQTYIPRQAVTDTDRHRYRTNPAARPVASNPRELGMTDRQIDVLQLMRRGMSNKVICRKLDLAEGTVKVHVSNVLRALGVHTRTQAVIAASEMDLDDD